jgi:hypothetical protein
MTANNGQINGQKASSDRSNLDKEPKDLQTIGVNLIDREINSLVAEIQTLVASSTKQFENKIQKELSKLLSVSRKASKLANQKETFEKQDREAELKIVTLNLKIAIDAIKQGGNLLLAKKLRQDAEFALRRFDNSWKASFLNCGSPNIMGLNVRYIHFRYKPRAPTKVPVTYCRGVWHMPLI